MAIALRGTSAALGTGTTSVTVAAPAGTTTGDVLLAFIVDESTNLLTTTAPTGWSVVAGVVAAGTGGRLQAFYAIVGLGGLTGTSWTWTGLTTTSSGIIVGYSGVDATRPFDVSGSGRANASGTTGTTSITTVTANAQVVAAFASVDNGCTWSAEACATSPTLTEQFDAANGTTHSIAIADGSKATAGATGASSATMSANAANRAILLALAAETASGVKITKAVGFAVLETVNPPVWPAGAVFHDGVQNVGYSSSIDIGTVTLPVTFSVTVGSLPAGLSLSSSGEVVTISGTPTGSGTSTFTVEASNAYGIADKSFSLVIASATSLYPAQTDVRQGVSYGAGVYTGSAYIPIAADVRHGTNVDATTGTAWIPSPNDVRSGTAVDATTGNMTLPTAAQVLVGVGFGASGTEYTGTVTLPAQSDVRSTVQYGAGGTEFTGTYTGGGGGGGGSWTWG